jgi:hypothetical protein
MVRAIKKLENEALFGLKLGHLGLKNGRNPGFAVTDSSTGKNVSCLYCASYKQRESRKMASTEGRGWGQPKNRE